METMTAPSPAEAGAPTGLTLSREQIGAARTRGNAPSDGGSTGRSDQND
ncbi:hypothetical protein [Streptosporangium subroseum]|nr:hypothetical protein OHB15_40935 [Streptosporangium subroseum]